MKQLPFRVFKRSDRRFFSVIFKNENAGKCLREISTKKETETEAIQVAYEWLGNGIPEKGELIDFKKYSLRDMAKETDVSKADADFICILDITLSTKGELLKGDYHNSISREKLFIQPQKPKSLASLLLPALPYVA